MRRVLLISCLALQVMLHGDNSQIKPEKNISLASTLRERIKELNSTSIPYVENFWGTNNRYDFLLKIFENQWKPQAYHRRRHAFYIINTTTHATDTLIQESTTWQDLSLFAGKKIGDSYVGQTINRAKTELGLAQFLSLLASSTAEKTEISRRQNIVKTLLKNKNLLFDLTNLFASCAESEVFLFSMYGKHDKFKNDLEFGYFFTDPIFEYFNDKPWAITTKHTFDLANRGVNTLVECLGIKSLILFTAVILFDKSNPWFKKLSEEAVRNQRGNRLLRYIFDYLPDLAKAGLSIHSIYATAASINKEIDAVSTDLMFENLLHIKLIFIARIFKTLQTITDKISSDSQLFRLLPELQEIPKLIFVTKKQNAPLRAFLDLIQDETFNEENIGKKIINRGNVIVAYRSMHNLKELFLPALQAFSLLDAYCGIATLMDEQKEHFCFAQLEESTTPHISLENFINPLIAPEKAIPNTIELGNNSPSRNCIITGPNAGGKSTLIKAIGINVLMAQSLGVAAARSCSITPFNFVATYLNITDDISNGNSLFKAEVLRTQELINKLDTLPQGQYGLLIFDEIFNGTTPTEGSIAARVVGEHLGTQQNGITIIATHFDLLTQLEQVAECSYKNYKVTVKINPDGSLAYPFKLETGVSQQRIALDVLRAEGYDGTIVAKAEALLNKKKKKSLEQEVSHETTFST